MKVRLGIIGTGIAARVLHLKPLLNLRDRFAISCVCNHTEPKAREFAALAGEVPYVLDYHDLLARKDVDAVFIILPFELNRRVTLDSLEAGKHVMVEKPLAASLDDAEMMSDFPARFNTVMMVAENYRYDPVFLRAKEIMQAGRIGEPYSAIWNQFTFAGTDNEYARTSWRINHKYPGGFVMDAGIHNIAVFRDLFGEITAGVAFNRGVNPAIGRMDSMTFQFTFESGVNGVLNAYFSANGIDKNELLILGTEGSLVVAGNRISVRQQGKAEAEEVVKTDKGYQRQLEDFYYSIVNHAEPVSSFAKAYKDFQTMVLALDSATKWEELKFAVRSPRSTR